MNGFEVLSSAARNFCFSQRLLREGILQMTRSCASFSINCQKEKNKNFNPDFYVQNEEECLPDRDL